MKWIISALIAAVVITVVVSLLKKSQVKPQSINPYWKAEVDAAVNAGYDTKEAEAMASKTYPQYLNQ